MWRAAVAELEDVGCWQKFARCLFVCCIPDVPYHFGIGPAAIKAVDAVDLTIAEGSFFAMLGPSGSGKSTIGRSVLKLVEPESGHILFGE